MFQFLSFTMFGIETNAKEEMDLSLLPVFFLNE